MSAFIVSENWPIKIEKLRWIDIYMTVLFLFTWVWLVFGELRTKVIEVTIENNSIEKKNYLSSPIHLSPIRFGN
jgi:hypothetical protein